MITIHYFASIRELLDQSQQQLELPDRVSTVDELIQHLISREPEKLQLLNDSSKVLIAVDQTVVDRNHILSGSEEVAFFPPMTGG
ncbi:MAG: molybdopterin converting factor subunit 1 [Gammaproteobacteria bacterium]|jgi:molybdopterin synthase sulfur carrier subunit|nr:molybdopterin converting factor subunit 1 [Gammaproteobacteria bacterium]MDP6097871.1 molybdopterin converting factor subunit 1 [Gammaproteobacteria bacterium]MDP7455266.1 molybdopterin converting factor subunit 1 [Gammaproteobacteria bacterium]HJO12157.1 molybdopterin converting factor subunit 1 [Gammaproteobacteria bacterium]|tara:strand:- start:370 stop:624 length:255 start_codon:yes stop_codon:yes gene_type:complete